MFLTGFISGFAIAIAIGIFIETRNIKRLSIEKERIMAALQDLEDTIFGNEEAVG